MSPQKYTFEDWKTGQIYRDFENQEIENFDYQKVNDIGWLPSKLYEQGFIPVEEFRKIDEAQKDTFFKTVNQNVKVKVKQFKIQLEGAYNKTELIRTKTQSLKNEVNRAPSHLLEKVYSGKWSKIGIDYSRHMAINDPRFIEGGGMLYFSNQLIGFDGAGEKQTIDLKGKHSNSYNQLFALTIIVRFLDKLEELYKDKYSEDSEKTITRDLIIKKAYNFKRDGMSVKLMFKEIKSWLLDELGFTEDEIKERFNFSLKDPDAFNRFVNKNAPHHK